jgi:hypothetical protein
MNDIKLGMCSLAVIAALAVLEFLGLRQPIRDGLETGRAWLVAKALALRSEVWAFIAWVFHPKPEPTWRDFYEIEGTVKHICGDHQCGGKSLCYDAVPSPGREPEVAARPPRRKRRPKR